MILSFIEFDRGQQFPIVRRKHFTNNEIFAFVGGLLGIFLGISLMSFAEVVNLFLEPLFKNLAKAFCFKSKKVNRNVYKNEFSNGFENVKSYFGFYLKESSIHGLKFLSNAKNCFEKIFWSLIFSFSMAGCFFMIHNLYKTTDFKAVTLIIDDKLMNVAEIPFPAITFFGSFPRPSRILLPNLSDEEVIETRNEIYVFDDFSSASKILCRNFFGYDFYDEKSLKDENFEKIGQQKFFDLIPTSR